MHQEFFSAKAQSRERSQTIAPQQLISTHRAKAVMALGGTPYWSWTHARIPGSLG